MVGGASASSSTSILKEGAPNVWRTVQFLSRALLGIRNVNIAARMTF